ncbi:NAD-dependent epimerase/dehydratase family protein [Oceanibacterium hippocampi]|uniref:UDP-glucose 4-epimerase n=1 Tax=Oceanibacterium hippocampi TaxID=745714 RepID=A0A1Y5S9A1_9PROT|nr:NAD-dependent epimerase/dehydratase family protein [Oceanibacterium hippocampi]SLN35377.1 UDP-glucose 4-epimerase [Oceanibacterium hippocampi]
MTVLITGVAGFIGFHVAEALIARGERVVGIDSLNDYYPVSLKQARLERLGRHNAFSFARVDISDLEGLKAALVPFGPIRRIVHLAAQAGVRYSIDNPFAYAQANLVGHLAILEHCRHQDGFEHLVYASSSSVYGGNKKVPFAVGDPVDHPVSLYAATKKADELMSHAYSHLYRFPQTGLRFFTVYGPWGRPDMAYWLFTEAILKGKPIRIFNHGDMKRDFTYIDDIVAGIVAALDNPPTGGDGAPQRVYNIGNHRAEPLMKFVSVLEDALGRKAEKQLEPMQPGDVYETYADIGDIERDLGYRPTTTIEEGLPKFVRWYRDYHGV